MKKWICCLMALIVALLPCALAAPGDVNLGMDVQERYQDSFSGGFVLGDALYLSGYSHLFRYRAGDAELEAIDFVQNEVTAQVSRNVEKIFSDGERAWALVVSYRTEGGYSVEKLELCPLEIGEDGAKLGEGIPVPLEEMSYASEESVYLVQINTVAVAGGWAYMTIYDGDYRESMRALNLSDGSVRAIEAEGCERVTPYRDGQLLLTGWDYASGERYLSILDPESGELTPAGQFASETNIEGLAYSAESDRCFYVKNGYLMACDGLDLAAAQPVAEMSAAIYGSNSALLLPGDLYACITYEVCCVRSTQRDGLPEERLVVNSRSYGETVTKAYYAFSNAHGEVSTVISNDYAEDTELIERMLSRDDSVDIYVLRADSRAYEALYERGYLTELDDDAISQAVSQMYPGLRAVLERDGRTVAVPVEVSGWTLGINAEAFEKLGLSRDELPTDWKGFLALLERLPELLPGDGSVRAFDEYMTRGSVMEELLSRAMTDYHNDISAGDREPSYDTPELQEILEGILNLDYAALELKEDEEDEDGGGVVYADGQEAQSVLLNLCIGCAPGNSYDNFLPWPLTTVTGGEPRLTLDLYVAFVNPFSKRADLAQEFLARILDNLSETARYAVSDELNEPLRDPYYESNMESYDTAIAEQEAAIAQAEPVDRPALEETLRQLQEYREQAQDSWMISEEEIALYRARGERLCCSKYNHIYSDESGELSDLAGQFMQRRIDAKTFLKALDQKLRMMMLEGN